MSMERYNIISAEQIDRMLDEEAEKRMDYLTFNGYNNGFDGLFYELWEDTRDGNCYAVRKTRTINMGFNSNDPGTVEQLVDVVEREGACYASWGVTGRTAHAMLGRQLAKELPQYDCEIYEESYIVKFSKKQ